MANINIEGTLQIELADIYGWLVKEGYTRSKEGDDIIISKLEFSKQEDGLVLTREDGEPPILVEAVDMWQWVHDQLPAGISGLEIVFGVPTVVAKSHVLQISMAASSECDPRSWAVLPKCLDEWKSKPVTKPPLTMTKAEVNALKALSKAESGLFVSVGEESDFVGVFQRLLAAEYISSALESSDGHREADRVRYCITDVGSAALVDVQSDGHAGDEKKPSAVQLSQGDLVALQSLERARGGWKFVAECPGDLRQQSPELIPSLDRLGPLGLSRVECQYPLNRTDKDFTWTYFLTPEGDQYLKEYRRGRMLAGTGEAPPQRDDDVLTLRFVDECAPNGGRAKITNKLNPLAFGDSDAIVAIAIKMLPLMDEVGKGAAMGEEIVAIGSGVGVGGHTFEDSHEAGAAPDERRPVDRG